MTSTSPSPPPLPPRAYVVSQFPEFCETFILNEIVELGKRGVLFTIFSLKRCRDGQFQPGARELMDRATVYLPSLWAASLIWAHLVVAFARPISYLSCLWLVMRSLTGSFRVFAKTLYVFLQAPWFAREARRRGLAHIHSHWASIPSSAGLFIARMAGVTFSFTAHAYDIFIDQTLLPEKIRAARYVVTCTEYNHRYLRERFPSAPPEKIRAIYHGIDLDIFDHAHDVAREEPVILSVGRLCDTKGFPDLIAACAILRTRGVCFSCRIVGEGYMRAELEALIRRERLEDRVVITGLLPRERLIEEYRRARVFALPCVITPRGDRDGLPNVLLEAMAMGLPAVVTNISALPEAVIDGETGLLAPPRSPEALAGAIEKLWGDPALRARMGEKARGRARERFGLRENMERLEDFVRERR